MRFSLREYLRRNIAWGRPCALGGAVHALDLAQACKFLKVAANRHIRNAQCILEISLTETVPLLPEQLPNLILSLCLNHDESSPFSARISFKQ